MSSVSEQIEIEIEQPLINGETSNVDTTAKASSDLYGALLQGNWWTIKDFIKHRREAFTVRLTPSGETGLHLAVKQGLPHIYMSDLIKVMPREAMAMKDDLGNTVLHMVVERGNFPVARLVLEKNDKVTNISSKDGSFPLHLAAMRGHRQLTYHLFTVASTTPSYSIQFQGESGARLMRSLINAGFYDLALHLLDSNWELACLPWEGLLPLEVMAGEPIAFPSGTHFNIWEFLIYPCVPALKTGDTSLNKGSDSAGWGMLGTVLDILLPPLKRVRQKKFMHDQALRLVYRLRFGVVDFMGNAEASSILTRSLLLGAQNGIDEIVTAILLFSPHAINFVDEENHSIFHISIMYRHEKIFKIAHHRIGENTSALLLQDKERNNILHLAGLRVRRDQLDLNPGDILQMQRELQWYKEVEKLVTPLERKSENVHKKTPLTIFDEEHRDMATNEKQWMTSMANSCIVAASLIATVAFAAAITVPGGNNSNGLPIFSSDKVFLVFAISDAIALLLSTTSVLSFLSIFTSRYSVSDFLYSLPNRLIIGLISLLLAVAFLLIAFSCAVFLVVDKKIGLILVIIALACVPMGLFARLQLPPLVNMIKSTYGPSSFG